MYPERIYSYQLESIMIERTLTLVSRLGCRVFQDGSAWCCLYGPNLEEGIAGFGETPQKAVDAFELVWHRGVAP